jgi:hypothetical protein
VVEVVASHGFDDGGEGHGATFGMGNGLVGVGRQSGLDEDQVPAAEDGERGERFVGIDGRVAGCPLVLIEGLDHVVVLSEGLAKAEGEDGFAVGEMAEDVAGAPFAGRTRGCDFGGADGLGEGFEARGRGGQDGEGVLAAQKFGVGIDRVDSSGHSGSLSGVSIPWLGGRLEGNVTDDGAKFGWSYRSSGTSYGRELAWAGERFQASCWG